MASVKLSADRTVVWEATGETVYGGERNEPVPLTPDADTGDVSFVVAHVDQAGFLDAAGAAVTGWVYTLTYQVQVGGVKSSYLIHKAFQVADGLATLDLDLIPDEGAVSVPAATAPTVGVTSVAGVAGPAVGAGALATALNLDQYATDTDLSTGQAAQDTALAAEVTRATTAESALVVPQASTTVQGKVELATTSEATNGTDTQRAVTPAGLKAAIDAVIAGAPGALDTLNEIATQLASDESAASALTTLVGAVRTLGDATALAAVQAAIDARVPQATATTQGKVELATTAEATTGTDTDRAITAAGLALSRPRSSLSVMAGSGDLVPVAAHSGCVGGIGTASYSPDALRTWSCTPFTLAVATPIVVLEFVNWSAAATDTDGPAAMTLRVGLENAAGVILPVKFQGADTISVPPGGTVRTDPIFVDGAAGDLFHPRVCCTMASGTTYVYNGVAYSSRGWASSPVQDSSRSGTQWAGGANGAVVPSRILGKPAFGAAPRVVAIIGDSIAQGASHSLDQALGGFTLALKNQNVPSVKIAKGGETGVSFATIAASSRRLAACAGCTDAIVQYGTNDFAGASTLAQVQAALITVWQRLVRMGMSVRQTTITPRTTSTDSWATTTNQTPVAGFTVGAKREQFNEWVRDGAPILAGVAVATGSNAGGTLRAGTTGHPLVGYIEVADAVESARNSGLWKVTGSANGWTSDGIHPLGDTPRAAIAAAMPTYT